MNEQRNNNGRGIFYGVIGVATLVVAIIGATFAYFTATADVNGDNITGNMATVTFGVNVKKVTKVDETKGGLIPMTNAMIDSAVTNANGICTDNPGNAVCQIYKITVTNTGSASLFVDGWVNLTGGSGTPTDLPNGLASTTTMRWVQVWCTASGEGETETVSGCTTTGTSTADGTTNVVNTLISNAESAMASTGANTTAIKTAIADVTTTGTIKGNSYTLINNNFIRASKTHTSGAYSETDDITSGLVYNQYLAPSGATAPDAGKDVAVMYVAVWLSETGTNQTAGSTGAGAAASPTDFFTGTVIFNSASGAEVTATFNGIARVAKTDAATQDNGNSSQQP